LSGQVSGEVQEH